MSRSTAAIALVMALVLTLQGCSTISRFADKPETTEAQKQTDFNTCHDSKSTVGSWLTGFGVLIWPLLIVGLPVTMTGVSNENSCMEAKGYALAEAKK